MEFTTLIEFFRRTDERIKQINPAALDGAFKLESARGDAKKIREHLAGLATAKAPPTLEQVQALLDYQALLSNTSHEVARRKTLLKGNGPSPSTLPGTGEGAIAVKESQQTPQRTLSFPSTASVTITITIPPQS